MKQSLGKVVDFLIKLNEGTNKTAYKINGMPFEFLVYFLSLSKIKKWALVVDDESFNTAYDYCLQLQNVIDLNIYPHKETRQSGPVGFVSNFEQLRLQFMSYCSVSGLPDRLVCSNTSFVEKSFSKQAEEPFSLMGCNYMSLHSWLINNNYHLVDSVSAPGEYCTKGAIVDLFSLAEKKPIRCSFFDDIPELYYFNVTTQITDKKCSSYLLGPTPSKQNHSIELECFNHSLFFINKLGDVYFGNCIELPVIPVELKLYKYESKPKIPPSFDVNFNNIISSSYFLFSDCLLSPLFRPPDTSSRIEEDKMKYLSTFSGYEDGDFLTHSRFGIGIYRGFVESKGGSGEEKICIEYLDGGKVYVSVSALASVDFYASKFIQNIEISSLSKRGSWSRRINSAKKQSEEFVDDLLKNYTERHSSKRMPYLKDNSLENAFLQTFLFEDTPDQKSVWEEIKCDMESDIPMDRLLCGDVGFGKTEIAMRAAFRAVCAGKQVAVLVPTTILSSQHFSNFSKRLSPFSVNVDFISGFRSNKEIKNIYYKLKKGIIDIIIGTHSLFSKTIAFKQLGLLVVDEEHRFGVKQKELLLKHNPSLDILTMSATPIPRTLHLSLSGIKNISTMHSPPRARLPIITQIKFYNIDLIKRAILFEVKRGGQVFFVHNTVSSLKAISTNLKRYLPEEIKINTVHGQDNPSNIEKIMVRFIEKKIDVLVCTSIIESGIDIPNANTIIINKANRMGLSQLYQMRGRVGRGFVQAYAYMLIPEGHSLSKNAFRRLKGIEKNSELGAGLNISQADLSIRGAGTVFGYRQSGGATKVGLGLYTKMINSALQKQNIIEKEWAVDPEIVFIKLIQKHSIPSEYIESDRIRLEFYKKISTSSSQKELNDAKVEMLNRYGPPPKEVNSLFDYSLFLIMCARGGVCRLVESTEGLWTIGFVSSLFKNNIEQLISLITSFVETVGAEMRFMPEPKEELLLQLSMKTAKDNYTLIFKFLDKLNTSIIKKLS